MHEAECNLPLVNEVGAWSDRWRFRLGAGSDPRARALGQDDWADLKHIPTLPASPPPATLCSADTPAATPCSPSSASPLGREGLEEGGPFMEIDLNFPEAPPAIFQGPHWKLVQARRYHHKEAIHLKELRAVLFGYRRRLRRACYHGKRHLFLCDNMGISLALEKGRAANVRVLKLCRQWAALSLASGSRTRFRWIPSEVNPPDDASRWFDPKPDCIEYDSPADPPPSRPGLCPARLRGAHLAAH